jgi:hypothetical protein
LRLRKDALRESRNHQEQNEALAKAAPDFTEGIGIIKAYNLPGENQMRFPTASGQDWGSGLIRITI